MRRIRWERRAVDDLLAIPDPTHAIAVDAAVQRFAEAGQGFLRVLGSDLRLYPADAPYFVQLRYEDEAVYVWRVLARSLANVGPR